MSRNAWQCHAAVVTVSFLALLLAGCAKEPATTMAFAPSPTGASSASTSGSEEGGEQGVIGPGGTGVAGVEAGRSGGPGGQDLTGRGSRRSDFNAGGGAGGRSDFDAGGGAGGRSDFNAGGASAGASQSMVAAARPQPKEFTTVTVLEDIHFDFDKYEIRPEDAQILSMNAQWLREHPRALILIEGHCDDRGTNEYNLALGNHRAVSALKYLVAQGIPANRMTTLSYGEERPLCTEETEDCWARNRRAHFLVKRQ